MSAKRIREIKQYVKEAGLEIDPTKEIKVTGGEHFKVWLRKPGDSESRFFFFTSTPSDARGDKNKLSLLRRFAQGLFDPLMGRPGAGNKRKD